MVNQPYSPPKRFPRGPVAGVGLVVVGIAGVAYGILHAKSAAVTPGQPQVAFNPRMPFAPVNQTIAATVTWVNPSTSAISFGVQGFVIEGSQAPYNVVGGHFWTSANLAQQAIAAYFAGNTSQAAQLATAAANRVYSTTVQPGQTGIATLYDILTPAAGQRFVFLLAANPPGGRLIFSDPTGTPLSAFQKAAGTTQLATSVVVG